MRSMLRPADGELHLVPAERGRWLEAVAFLLPLMLASLHSIPGDDVRAWLGTVGPEKVGVLVDAFARPAPLGAAPLIRDRRGRVNDLPRRDDRVAAIRVTVEQGDRWAFEARVVNLEPVRTH